MTNPKKPKSSIELTETRDFMKDYVTMLVAVFVVALISYGEKVLLFTALAVVTCELCRKIGEKILRCEFSSRDMSSLVIGTTIVLLLPPTASWWMAVCGGAFAIIVCVLPFGTTKNSPFVPAAAAVAFMTLCWPERMFNFSETGMHSITKMLSQGNSIGRNAVVFLEVFTGEFPSYLGAGSAVVLLGALVYLTIRRHKNAIPVYTFLAAVIIMAILFPRASTGRLVSVIMELCGGSILFCAVFFMSYPSVVPERILPKAAWGFTGGVICMLLRYFGTFEEPAVFGVLIICAMSELFDKLPLTKKEKIEIFRNTAPQETVETVVSDDVLSEIPDVEELQQEAEDTDKPENVEEELIVTAESESLEAVVSEENTVNEAETPFSTGGDGNE